MPEIQDKEKNKEKNRKAHGWIIGGVSAGLIVILIATAVLWAPLMEDTDSTSEPTRPAATASMTAAAETAAPTVFERRQGVTLTATPEPPQWGRVDFSKSVIIGSSTTEALYIHDLLEGANYLYGTGLTVETVMTKPMPGSSVAVIDELRDKDYNQVFLAFGLNELGWPDDNIFMQYYANVIARVREYLPTAAIYVESVLPVGIGTSARNRFGVNQNRINEFNDMLRQFAEEQGVHFLDVSTEMKGVDGYLPQGDSVDGIHPNLEACRKWTRILARKVEEVLNAESGATPPPDVAEAQAAATAAAEADAAAIQALQQAAAEQNAAEQPVAADDVPAG